MENPPFWWYLQGKVGIFMGYVSLPEGKFQLLVSFKTMVLSHFFEPKFPAWFFGNVVSGQPPKKQARVLFVCLCFLQFQAPQGFPKHQASVWPSSTRFASPSQDGSHAWPLSMQGWIRTHRHTSPSPSSRSPVESWWFFVSTHLSHGQKNPALRNPLNPDWLIGILIMAYYNPHITG